MVNFLAFFILFSPISFQKSGVGKSLFSEIVCDLFQRKKELWKEENLEFIFRIILRNFVEIFQSDHFIHFFEYAKDQFQDSTPIEELLDKSKQGFNFFLYLILK